MFGNLYLPPAKRNAILLVLGSRVSLDGKVRGANWIRRATRIPARTVELCRLIRRSIFPHRNPENVFSLPATRMYRIWWYRVAPCCFLARRREFGDRRTFLSLRCEIGRRLRCYSALLFTLYRSWTDRYNLAAGIVAANTCRDFDWTHKWGVCGLWK